MLSLKRSNLAIMSFLLANVMYSGASLAAVDKLNQGHYQIQNEEAYQYTSVGFLDISGNGNNYKVDAKVKDLLGFSECSFSGQGKYNAKEQRFEFIDTEQSEDKLFITVSDANSIAVEGEGNYYFCVGDFKATTKPQALQASAFSDGTYQYQDKNHTGTVKIKAKGSNQFDLNIDTKAKSGKNSSCKLALTGEFSDEHDGIPRIIFNKSDTSGLLALVAPNKVRLEINILDEICKGKGNVRGDFVKK